MTAAMAVIVSFSRRCRMTATHFQDGEDWEARLQQLLHPTKRAGALDTTDAYGGIAAEEIPSVGSVVCLIDNTLYLSDVAIGNVCGVAIDAAELGNNCRYVTRGFVFATSWLSVTGDVRLTAGRTYFLTDRGKLSLVPSDIGYSIPIGQAQTEHVFDVNIGTKVRL